MSINIGDNFSYLGKKFLDAREHFDTLAEMKVCNDVPNGFITYCDETETRYEYHSDNQEDTTLGKWRVFKSVPDVNFDDYVTQGELEEAIKDVDVTEQLKDYAKKTDIPNVPTKTSELTNDSGYLTSIPSEYVTDSELNAKGYLTEHQDISHLAEKGYVDEAIKDVDVTEQLREYAKLTDLDGLFDDVALNEAETTDTQTAIDFYSNGEVVKTVYFSGGSGTSATSAYISTELSENVLVSTGENFDLTLDFSSPNLGKGTLKVFINDIDAVTKSIGQGESTTPISGDLFSKGQNKIVVYVLDRVGVMSNSLTFYVRYGSLEVTSDFDTYTAYDYGSVVRYYFTPTTVDTSLSLTMYMSIDGQTQSGVSCTSDTRGYFTFPSNLSVGNHLCKAWVQDSNGSLSNELVFNLIILDDTQLVVATDTHNTVSIEEGEQLSLDYKVYMKGNSTFNVYVYVDGEMVNRGTCGLATSYYKTSSLTEGIHTIKIEAYDITETKMDYVTWTIEITPSTYQMKMPTTAGAVLIATAKNKSNADENREIWVGTNQDGERIEAELVNFSFNDESGWGDDQLLITGDSYVEIPIAPLSENAKYGFTLDIEFSTKPIGVEDALVLDLWDEENNCGIKITTEELIMQSRAGNRCDLYFEEDVTTSAMFVIDRHEKTAKVYLNGVMCEAFHLTDYEANGVKYLEDFTVTKNIKLGGSGHTAVKNIRVYQVALTTDEIINNFISNETVKSKQRELVEFQKGNDLPTMTIYGDFSGLGKNDKKPCDIVYVSTDTNKYGESFTIDGKYSQLQYQGTSSMAYPIKNYRINPRDKNGKKKINPFIGGKPESRFTLKADFITSNHAHNTGMAKFINDKLYHYNDKDEKTMNPMRWYILQNGGDVNTVRETINGFPIRLILVNDGATTLNEGQAEPTPGNTKDMGIFNFNNDKDNVKTLGFDTDIFPNALSFEVTANSDTSAGAFVPFFYKKRMTFKKNGGEYGTNRMPVFLPKGKLIEVKATVNFAMHWYNSSGGQIARVVPAVNSSTGYASATATLPSDAVTLTFVFYGSVPSEILIDGIPYECVEGAVSSTELEELYTEADELEYLQQSFELRYPDEDDVGKDYGYLGMEISEDRTLVDYTLESSNKRTSFISTDYLNGELLIVTKKGTDYKVNCNGAMGGMGTLTGSSGSSIELIAETTMFQILVDSDDDYFYLNGTKIYFGDEQTEWIIKNPYTKNVNGLSQDYGLKRVIDWVGNCTDEEFVADFDKYFNRHYTLRYYLLVVLMAGVDKKCSL